MVRKPFRMRWLIGVIVVGAIVSWTLGWWQFDISQPSSSGVSVAIDAPDTVASGEIVNLQIHITNEENVAIAEADLSIQWPDELRVIESSVEPRSIAMSSWTLDEIAVGEKVTIDITAQAFGEVGDAKVIDATLVYELQNFSSNFFTEGVHNFVIGTKIVDVVFDETDDLPPLTENVWRIVVTNADDETLPLSWLRIVFPQGFEVIEISPEHDVVDYEESKAAIVPLDGMEVGEQQVLKITGLFAAGTQGKSNFVWQYGIDTDEDPRIIQEGSYEQYVIGDEAEVEVLLNGEEELSELSWGDELVVNLRARNITSEDLTNLEWSLTIPPSMVTWSGIRSDSTLSTDQSSGVVRLLPEDNDVLKIIPAGDELELSVIVPLASSAQSQTSFTGSARLRLTTESSEEPLSFTKSFGPIQLSETVNWHTTAHYYSDEGIQVGSGPLPPRVDDNTNYEINWNVGSVAGNVGSLTVRATLPPDVRWNNQFSSNQGNVTYVASTRQVVWSVSDVSGYDFTLGELEAKWEAGITPNESDLGTVITLTGAAQIELTTSDGEIVRLTNPALTTALEGDIFAQNKGVVRE